MGDDSPLGLVAQATAPALRKGREQGQAAQLRHAPTHGAEEDQIGGIAGADYIHCGAGSHDASVPASTRALPWIESLGSKLVRGQTRDGPASAGQPRQPRDSLATASPTVTAAWTAASSSAVAVLCRPTIYLQSKKTGRDLRPNLASAVAGALLVISLLCNSCTFVACCLSWAAGRSKRWTIYRAC